MFRPTYYYMAADVIIVVILLLRDILLLLYCLPMSALWGLLITAAMALLWTPLEKLLARIPQRAAKAVAFTLAALLLIDFCGNFIYLCATGAHYYLF